MSSSARSSVDHDVLWENTVSGRQSIPYYKFLLRIIVLELSTLATLSSMRISRFRIKTIANAEVIVGGFGDVTQAKLRTSLFGPDPVVALKTLRPQGDRNQRIRVIAALARELKVWRDLKHPNILALEGFYYDESSLKTAWIATLWQKNRNVLKYVEATQAGFFIRLKLATDTARGLSYLHGLSPPVCHADIKAENTLVDDGGNALICDFGLAKILEDIPSGLTTTKTVCCNTRYAARELLVEKGSLHTLSSDVWAWGCLVLVIMTGILPYHDGRNDPSVIAAIMSNEPPISIDSLELPEFLCSLLCRCWHQKPSLRPPMDACVAELSVYRQGMSSSGISREDTIPPATVANGRVWPGLNVGNESRTDNGLQISSYILGNERALSEKPEGSLHLRLCIGARLEDNLSLSFRNFRRDSTAGTVVDGLRRPPMGFKIPHRTCLYVNKAGYNGQSEWRRVDESTAIYDLLQDPGAMEVDLFVVGREMDFTLGIVVSPTTALNVREVADHGIVLELSMGANLDEEVKKIVGRPCHYVIGEKAYPSLGEWQGTPSPIGLRPYASDLKIIIGRPPPVYIPHHLTPQNDQSATSSEDQFRTVSPKASSGSIASIFSRLGETYNSRRDEPTPRSQLRWPSDDLPSPFLSPILEGNPALTKALESLRHLQLTCADVEVISGSTLARGGSGVVKQARLKGTQRIVAVMVLRCRARCPTLARVLREAVVWAELRHPNILSLEGFVLPDSMEEAWFISSYEAYGNILEYCEKISATEATRLKFVLDTANGLSYLHGKERPVIHGDIKGAHVLVTAQLRAVYGDFGLSKVLHDTSTGLESTDFPKLGGTLRHLSPEFFAEGDTLPMHTKQSDIWAWGCLVAEIMTGEMPYHTVPSDAQLMKKLTDGSLPASLTDPRFPDVVMKCLADSWKIVPRDRKPVSEHIQALQSCITSLNT